MSPRRAARTDNNHAAVCAALRKCGLKVQDTHALGAGFPDLVAVDPQTGKVALIEVKDGDLSLSEPEVRLTISLVSSAYRVVFDEQQAADLAAELREERP
jgi:hypothetical protein